MNRLVLLYPFFFIIFYLATNRRYRKDIQFLSIFLLFFLSSIASVYLAFNVSPYCDKNYYGIIPIVFHCCMFGMILKAAEKLTYFGKKRIISINPVILKIVTCIVIGIGIPSFFIIIKDISFGMLHDDAVQIRANLDSNDNYYPFYIRYMLFMAKSYWVLALALMYYYICTSPKKIVTILLLLVCSLNTVVSYLSSAGRGAIIYYILTFIMLYLLVRRNIPQGSAKFIKLFFISLFGVLIAAFAVISFARFSLENSFYTGNHEGVIGSSVRYFGIGFCNFPQEFDAFWINSPGGGRLTFPFFVGESVSHLNVDNWVHVTFDLNTFATSVGSFVFDVGALPTVIIYCIFLFFVTYVSKRKLDLFTLFYAGWMYSYIVESVFYFSDIFNGARILSLLLIFFLDIQNRSLKTKNI